MRYRRTVYPNCAVSGYKSEEDIKEEEREQEEAQDFDMALALEKAQDVSDDRNLGKNIRRQILLKGFWKRKASKMRISTHIVIVIVTAWDWASKR